MTTLTIKDLSRMNELDRVSMHAVRGGSHKGMLSYYWGPQFDFAKNDFKFDTSQMLGQTQNTTVNNGNNAAFVSGIASSVPPQEVASNNLSLG